MRITAVAVARDALPLLALSVAALAEQGVDGFVVMDHRSCDGLAGWAAAARAEGLDITLLRTTDPAEWPGTMLTALARTAVARGADLVLPFSPDEMWGVRSAGGRLRDVLAAEMSPSAGALRVPAETFAQRRDVATVTCDCLATALMRVMPAAGPGGDAAHATVEEGRLSVLALPVPPRIVARAHPELVVAEEGDDAFVPDRPRNPVPESRELVVRRLPLGARSAVESRRVRGAGLNRAGGLDPRVGRQDRRLVRLGRAASDAYWATASWEPDDRGRPRLGAVGDLIEDAALAELHASLREHPLVRLAREADPAGGGPAQDVTVLIEGWAVDRVRREELRAAVATARDEAAGARDRAAAAVAGFERVTVERDRERHRAEGAEGRAAALAARLADAEARLADRERTLHDIAGSRSWRVTAPLRAATDTARRRRAAAPGPPPTPPAPAPVADRVPQPVPAPLHPEREGTRGVGFTDEVAGVLGRDNVRTVIDVGAHRGGSSALFRDRFPAAVVHAFEPGPAAFAALAERFAGDPDVRCVNVALGAAAGEATLVVPEDLRLARLTSAGGTVTPGREAVRVPVTTIDAYCAEHGITEIDVLKVDTEGHDAEVLRGAMGLLRRGAVRVVRVEASMNPENRDHVPASAILDLLLPLGYRLLGVYDQVHEWPAEEPHLRRADLAFVLTPHGPAPGALGGWAATAHTPPVPSLLLLGDRAHFAGSALAAALEGHWRIVGDPAEPHDAAILWSPWSDFQLEDPIRRAVRCPILNDTGFRCDKRHVEDVFGRVAGYGLAVDPTRHEGPMVVKSRRNAVHDGRVVSGPVPAPDPGCVYERLVDNDVGDGQIEDLRVAVVGGGLPTVYRKRRAAAIRFENDNVSATLCDAEDVLSADEIAVCLRFADEIGLEFGQLDVLRDRGSGRIYIVDANNTPYWPVNTMSDAESAEALTRLRRAFDDAVLVRSGTGAVAPGRSHMLHVLDRGLGQALSAATRMSVDAQGRPVPWMTYPAIQFLNDLDLSGARVFEFGTGSSTRWFAARCASVRGVDHDPSWHARVAADLPANVEVVLGTHQEAYTGAIAGTGEYDVIVVDGRWRRAAARAALEHLAAGGMVIVDNSDWMPRTTRMLREAGLVQIDFSGFGPVNDYPWTTSLFLRPGARLPRRDPDAAPACVGGVVRDIDRGPRER